MRALSDGRRCCAAHRAGSNALLTCLLTALCLSSTSDAGVLEFTVSTLDTREHADTTATVKVRYSNGHRGFPQHVPGAGLAAATGHGDSTVSLKTTAEKVRKNVYATFTLPVQAPWQTSHTQGADISIRVIAANSCSKPGDGAAVLAGY